MGKGCGCGVSKSVRVPSVSAPPVPQDDDDEAYWHLYVSWTNEDEPSPERPPSRPQSAATSGTISSMGAVQLSFLLDFVANKLPLGDTNIPTWSVAYSIIQPATAELGVPYVGLPDVQPYVLPYGSPRPYYFVSHAWSRPLRETSAMLSHHFRGRDPREVYVWMDIFAVQQRAFTAATEELDMAAVDAALKNSAGVLLCLDEAGAALRRTWCLYEAWMGATWQPRAATPPGAATTVAAGAGVAATPGGRDAPGPRDRVGGGGGGGSGAIAPIGVVALTSRAMLPEERARLFSKIDIRQSRSKYRFDREALLAAARSSAGPGGLDRVNHTLRLALMLQPLVPDVRPELYPGRVTQVAELWDMSRVDAWLALPESNKHFSAMSLYGPACSGKSVAAAAIAGHLASQGVPVAAHFCNVSDVRTLDPIALLLSLALQLTRAPRIGPRLLRQYGELSAGLAADLMSYNNTAAALEAAVEALLVQPLQRLLQPSGGAPKALDGDGAAAAAPKAPAAAAAKPSAVAAAAAAAVGRGWVDNSDLRDLGGGCDQDYAEDEDEGYEEDGAGFQGVKSLDVAGAKSMRAQSMRFVPPKVVVLIIDGIDQADGSIVGGSAPYDNQILQLIEEHLLKLPSYVRLILTSRSLSYIVPRLADRLTPLELTPDALRPLGAFMRNVRLALATIDPSLSRRQRAATAASLVTKSRGSLLYIKMALCCMELERDLIVAEAGDRSGLASSQSSRKRAGGGGGDSGNGASAEGGSSGSGPPPAPSRSATRTASRKLVNIPELPNTLGGLIERYLVIRLCQLDSIQKRNRLATVLAVLATAREPLTAMQLAAAVGGASISASTSGATSSRSSEAAAATAPPALLSPPTIAHEGLLREVVAASLGVLVRLRGPSGHHSQEVLLLHSAIAEWLQQSSPRILLSGSVVVDPAAGHRSLACHCRDDALACLHNGRLTPYGYSVRHIFLHAGLAALAATADADAAGSASPVSCTTTATGRSSGVPFRSRGSATSAANAAAVTLATALAAAAASADWSATLELLLQRLDLWTSIYTAGAGGSARWVMMALASLPACAIPSADPGSSDSSLFMLLAEARRWLVLYHGSLCWFPLAVVSSVATLPEDSALRGRALEFSAGPDPWELTGAGGPTATTVTVSNSASPTSYPRAPSTPPQQLQLPPRSGSPDMPRRGPAANGASSKADSESGPQEEQHLLQLSTGDSWSCCVQTLRTNMGRVLQVAMHPGGRLLATVHDEERGVFLWDVWGAKPLLTMARCYEMGRCPTAAFFTPDGRKLVCAARSVFVWEVSTGRLLFELCKAPPRKAASSSKGFRGGGGGGTASTEVGGDPDGPVVALAMSPSGGRVAAGHGNGVTRVWDVITGKLLAAMTVPHHRSVTALSFSPPAGATLIVAHGEGADAAPRAGAPVREEEIGDVPTQLIKADELVIHVWKVSGSTPKELEVLKGHTGRVNSLVFSTLDGNMVTGSADETIRIWFNDPKTPQSDFRQIFILGGVGQGVVHTMQFSAAPPPPPRRGFPPYTSSRKFAADGDGDVAGAIDFAAVSVANLTTAAFAANAGLSYDADGDGLALSARGSAAGMGPADAAAAAPTAAASDSSAVDPRGDLPVMAYSCGNGIIRLWSPRSQRQVGLLRGLEGPVHSLSFSGDGRLLASADQSDTGVVRVWDVGGACARDPLDSSPTTGVGGLQLRHPVELMALSPDGSRLAIVCANLDRENIRVIDVFTGRRLAVMGPGGAGGHEGKINAAAWSWDSSRLATGSDDLTVRVWYVGTPTAPPGNPIAAAAAIVAAELESRERSVQPASDSAGADGAGGEPAGDAAATGGGRVSRQSSRQASRSGSRGSRGAPDAEPAGGLAANKPGLCQLILSGHHRKVQCVAWAHSGKKLASGGYDQMVRIWDSATGEQLTLIYQVAWVSALAFSPDDARLVSGAGGKAVYMFNSTTGKNLAGHAGQSVEGSTSAAGTGGGAGAARTGTEGATSEDSWMSALRFNPDGTLLACRDMHSNVTLWDVSGMRLRPLRALDGTFREALFCPATGDLQLYDLTASGALVMHAIPAGSLPLGRAVQRSVTLSHPLLEFRGVAADTAVNHNAVVLLTADNRAFFFVSGSHLSVVRQEASRAERVGTAGSGELGWLSNSGGGGNASRRPFSADKAMPASLTSSVR